MKHIGECANEVLAELIAREHLAERKRAEDERRAERAQARAALRGAASEEESNDGEDCDPVTKRVKVGDCPACKAHLWADVDIEVNVTEPEWRDGRAVAYATPHLVSMAVAHSCWIDDDGERQQMDTAQLGDLGDVEQAWWDGHRDVCTDCNCPADANPYTRAAKGCDGDETAGEERA